MFEFLSMMNNYEERKVGRFEKDNLLVSTCYVNDSDQDYETALRHPKYNNNDLVVAEMYETKEKAKRGHKKWVKKMTAKELPKTLKDVSTSNIKKLCDSLDNSLN